MTEKPHQILEQLERNSHLISEMKDGCRFVNGVKIVQIEEKTEKDRIRNRNINLWRMRLVK